MVLDLHLCEEVVGKGEGEGEGPGRQVLQGSAPRLAQATFATSVRYLDIGKKSVPPCSLPVVEQREVPLQVVVVVVEGGEEGGCPPRRPRRLLGARGRHLDMCVTDAASWATGRPSVQYCWQKQQRRGAQLLEQEPCLLLPPHLALMADSLP